jgi:hypothetical protein
MTRRTLYRGFAVRRGLTGFALTRRYEARRQEPSPAPVAGEGSS